MSRSRKSKSIKSHAPAGPKPISLAEYANEARESCRHGGCCRNEAMLVQAYEQYLNDPKAPWNKTRRSRRWERFD